MPCLAADFGCRTAIDEHAGITAYYLEGIRARTGSVDSRIADSGGRLAVYENVRTASDDWSSDRKGIGGEDACQGMRH